MRGNCLVHFLIVCLAVITPLLLILIGFGLAFYIDGLRRGIHVTIFFQGVFGVFHLKMGSTTSTDKCPKATSIRILHGRLRRMTQSINLRGFEITMQCHASLC
jgi:hypothetical protein